MSPWDPQVSGSRPDFRPADEQFEGHAARLRALVGRRLVEGWTVWIVDEDWFADLPVVMRFDDGSQLEVSWKKFDDLSLTWDTIDVNEPPSAWVDWPLEWRRNAHAPLAALIGGAVREVRTTSFLFETWNAVNRSDRTAAWLTTGLWLATDRGDLHVFNALDENGLAAEGFDRDASHDWRPI